MDLGVVGCLGPEETPLDGEPAVGIALLLMGLSCVILRSLEHRPPPILAGLMLAAATTSFLSMLAFLGSKTLRGAHTAEGYAFLASVILIHAALAAAELDRPPGCAPLPACRARRRGRLRPP